GIYIEPIDVLIKQVSFGRSDFTDIPSITAHIVIGEEVTVLVSGIGVYQLIIAIYTTNSSCKSCITLRLTVRRAELLDNCIGIQRQCHHFRFHTAISNTRVYLKDICTPLLKDVVKLTFRYLVPVDIQGLIFRNNIA